MVLTGLTFLLMLLTLFGLRKRARRILLSLIIASSGRVADIASRSCKCNTITTILDIIYDTMDRILHSAECSVHQHAVYTYGAGRGRGLAICCHTRVVPTRAHDGVAKARRR